MTTTTRAARHDDEAALLEVDRATWGPTSSPAPVPDWSGRRFFAAGRDPDGFVVVELDGRVVGYAGVHQLVPLAAHAHVLTIDGLAVHPSAQGHGEFHLDGADVDDVQMALALRP